MELVVRKNDLLRELQLFQGIVERKNTIPILANVLLRAENAKLAVKATDLAQTTVPLFFTRWFTSDDPAKKALNRYRSHGEPAITVQNVSVGDGGKAIVGNVTQHASVIVSDADARRGAQP